MAAALIATGCARSGGSDKVALVQVNLRERHQVIVGWEATAESGVTECNPAGVRAVYPELIRRTVHELGLNRIRLEIRPSQERPAGMWSAYRRGEIAPKEWRRLRTTGINDNDDPFRRNDAGFQWGHPDFLIDTLVRPLQRELAARGERLYVNLTFVDFYVGSTPQQHQLLAEPEEYAEFVVAAFQHFRDAKGLVPDALEILLEPENTPYTGTQMGRALVAAARRLKAAGFDPDFIVGSSMRTVNALRYYAEMRDVPGVDGLIDEIAYHRYGGTSGPARVALANQAEKDRIRTSMLEHIGADFRELYEDLTEANVSAWQRFGLAYCSSTPNSAGKGVYWVQDFSDPNQPRLVLAPDARLLRQVFAYVRRGAQRVGATAGAGVRALAFATDSGRVVTIVESVRGQDVVIRGLPAGTYRVNFGTTGSRYNEELSPTTASAAGEVRVAVPEAGVVTVYQ